MKKLISAILMGCAFASLSSFAGQGQPDANACVNQPSFCTCYQHDAVSNCQKLGGGPLCGKGMGGKGGLLQQTSGEIKASGGTLEAFCNGSIVRNRLKINPDDCMADNAREFQDNGEVKRPDQCGWSS